jgi:hypothetical protein
MPMKKKSTLLFVVKKINYQSECEPDFSAMNSDSYSEKMKSAEFSPSARTIQRILDFARSYDVLETETAGQVEMNLN